MSGILRSQNLPCLTKLYKEGQLPLPPPTGILGNREYNDKICVTQDDITKLEVDAIVNAANKGLRGGSGVDGAVHKAAGRALLDECSKLGGCATGSAKITKGYGLPCKHVIHAVGPIYAQTREKNQHTTLLQGCYRKSLELAVENDLKSIAFSALSTGVYGYPSKEAAETAIGEVKKFLDAGLGTSLNQIIFCNFTVKDQNAYKEWLPNFFPPVADEPKTKDEKKESAPQSSEPLPEQLPDQSKVEPGYEEAPDAKKQKHEHATTDN